MSEQSGSLDDCFEWRAVRRAIVFIKLSTDSSRKRFFSISSSSFREHSGSRQQRLRSDVTAISFDFQRNIDCHSVVEHGM